jgi:hypothetical protein
VCIKFNHSFIQKKEKGIMFYKKEKAIVKNALGEP